MIRVLLDYFEELTTIPFPRARKLLEGMFWLLIAYGQTHSLSCQDSRKQGALGS